jgi:hypothetical protein
MWSLQMFGILSMGGIPAQKRPTKRGKNQCGKLEFRKKIIQFAERPNFYAIDSQYYTISHK